MTATVEVSEYIALIAFAAANPHAPDPIRLPWSRGAFTYATDGHVLIRVPRVPRVPDVPDCGAAPDADKMLATGDFQDLVAFVPDWSCPLPPLDFAWEPAASGPGGFHVVGRASIAIAGVPFDLRYVHLLASLPCLRVGIPPGEGRPLPFACGHTMDVLGMLMPLDGPCDTHFTAPLIRAARPRQSALRLIDGGAP